MLMRFNMKGGTAGESATPSNTQLVEALADEADNHGHTGTGAPMTTMKSSKSMTTGPDDVLPRAESLVPARSTAGLIQNDMAAAIAAEDNSSDGMAGLKGDSMRGVKLTLARHFLKVEVSQSDQYRGTKVADGSTYEGMEIPHWKKQISWRAGITGSIIGFVFSVITIKLGLGAGIIPSFNIPCGLLGFVLLKFWVKTIGRIPMFGKLPYTVQENTVAQTFGVAIYSLAYSGGFTSVLTSLNVNVYNAIGGASVPGNRVEDIYNPHFIKSCAFVALQSFGGVFILVGLRKLMIIDYRLIYPSGTATGILINSLNDHGKGEQTARRQVRSLGIWTGVSFLFSFFKWWFSGIGDYCGFDGFPSLGLAAYNATWYFDFDLQFVGSGMICPHIVDWSIMYGSIFFFGIMVPILIKKDGDWYQSGGDPSYLSINGNIQGVSGYAVFMSLGFFFGDGLYNLVKLTVKVFISLRQYYAARRRLPNGGKDIDIDLNLAGGLDRNETQAERAFRTKVFLTDRISYKIGIAGYLLFAVLCAALLPQLYPPCRWYFVVIVLILCPPLGFCNAYGCGLTDWDMSSIYGNLLSIVIAAWAGTAGGGVVSSMIVGNVAVSTISLCATLMQDFKTGYLTLATPKAMFGSQLVATFVGIFLSTLSFQVFTAAYPIGLSGGQYPAPLAQVGRSSAIVIASGGFGLLGKNCLYLTLGCFLASIALCVIKDNMPPKYARFMPIPMSMAIPFNVGAWLACDMCVGSVVKGLMEWHDRRNAQLMVPCIASGMMAGEGLWTLVDSILGVANKNPPICMQFMTSAEGMQYLNNGLAAPAAAPGAAPSGKK